LTIAGLVLGLLGANIRNRACTFIRDKVIRVVIRLVVGQIKQSLGKRNFYVELVMIGPV
jgi:hypothetical protein